MKNKLGLGTAQFGLDYGIANQSGKVCFCEVKLILQQASKAEIDLLDTAISYGDSQENLGKAGVAGFNVVSKLPDTQQITADIDSWVVKQVEESLNKLAVPSLYGLLLHRPENLLGSSGKKLINALSRVKSNGFAQKIGVSIYDPSGLDEIMRQMRIDLVQAPLNVVDRRLEMSGWLSSLQHEGVEVHTRSAFLQGLLLTPGNKLPVKFRPWAELWGRWFSELERKNISADLACLSYPLSLPEVDRVVIGVDNVDQLKTLIAASEIKLPQYDFSFMTSEDQMLINPSNWSAL